MLYLNLGFCETPTRLVLGEGERIEVPLPSWERDLG